MPDMSSTATERPVAHLDLCETPAWVTDALLCSGRLPLEPRTILDAGAGRGSITRRLIKRYPSAYVTAVDGRLDHVGHPVFS